MHRDAFRLSVDETRKIISFRFTGLAFSKDCTDELLEAMSKIEKPWLYKQIWDYRRFDSILEPADVERIALYWRTHVTHQDGPIPAAVLAVDPLTPARAKAYASLFPNLNIRSFIDISQALAWLDGETHSASAA